MEDVVIIGGGIIGCLIAYNLSKYDLKVLLLEKESDVCTGASGANSAIVHSGHDPKDNTLKCKYNLLGSRMFKGVCEELHVPYRQTGALVVAINKEQEEQLINISKKCIDRHIPYELIDGSKARELEPNLANDVSMALSLPSTAIFTPWIMCYNAIEEAYINGVKVKYNYEVKNIKKIDDYFEINNEIKCKVVINAAGIHCDDIANMVTKSPYKVEAKKGEYFILNHGFKPFLKQVIYPTPSSVGKGVLALPTIDNDILLGPTSTLTNNKNKVDTNDGLDYVKKEVNKIVKNIPWAKQEHVFAGVRPHIDLNDFYIKEDDKVTNFIHVAGIESPGLTASPAIAKDVVENMVLPKFKANLKKENKHILPLTHMKQLSIEERNKIIASNSDYGLIVCRCEKISLGEIKEAINRPLGATTVKGVRMRTRASMGGCQGGFCGVNLLEILSKELNKPINEINENKEGSNVLIARVKKC